MIYRVALLLLLLLLPVPLFAQGGMGPGPGTPHAAGGGGGIAFDASATVSYTGNVSFSWNHTTSGSNRYLAVAISQGDAAGSVSSVTYSGVSMSLVSSQQEASGAGGTVLIYGLIAPASGTNSLQVTVGGTPVEWAAVSSSWTGVHQTTPTGTPVTLDNGQAASITVNVSSASNEVVLDAVIAYASINTVGAGQTLIGDVNGVSTYTLSSSRETGTTTTTMSWTFDANRFAAMIAVALKPA